MATGDKAVGADNARSPSPWRTAAFVGFAILAVSIAAGAFYVVGYRTWRETYFRESGFRELGVLSDQIQAALSSRSSALKQAVTERADCAAPQSGADKVESPATSAANDNLRIQLELARLRLEECRAPATKSGAAAAKETPAATTTPGAAKGGDAVEITIEPASLPLRQTSARQYGRPSAEGSAGVRADSTVRFAYDTGVESICASANLSELIEPFVLDNGFHGVDLFVASTEGLAFERGPGNLRVGNAKHFGAASSGEAKKKVEPSPWELLGTSSGDMPTLEQMVGAKLFRDVPIASSHYKLMTQPLQLAGVGGDWVLGLVIPRQRFDADVASLSYGSVSWLPLVLLLLVLAAPLLKVRTMSRRGRYRARDARFLFISLFAFAGAAVPLALGLLSYGYLERALDADLRRLSQDLRTRLRQEIDDASESLQIFAARATARQVDGAGRLRVTSLFESCPSAGDAKCCNGSARKTRQCGRDLDGLDGCPPLEAGAEAVQEVEKLWHGPYPFLEMLVWTDAAGNQKEKWTRRRATTALINVSAHNWFKDLAAGHLWAPIVEPERPAAGEKTERCGFVRPAPTAATPMQTQARHPVLLHVLVSPNTGDTLALLTRKVEHQGEMRTITMVPELMSVMRPALPVGFGFAIVQSDGRVVFHSTASRSLYENFFEECDAANAIRAAIDGGVDSQFDGYYRGRKQRFYVHSLDGMPWSLVVFRDKELPRTVDLDILVTWLALFGMYLGLLTLAASLVHAIAPRDDGEWYWPERSRRRRYEDCAFVFLVIATAQCVVLARRIEPSIVSMAAMLALVLAGGALAYRCLAAADAPLRRRGRDLRRALAIVALGVAAGLGLVAAAFDYLVAATFVVAAVGVGLRLRLPSKSSQPPGEGVAPGAGTSGDPFSLRAVWIALAVLATAAAIIAAAAGRSIAATPLVLIAVSAAVMAWWTRRPWQLSYLAAGLLFFVVGSALPSALFYRDAFDLGMEVLVRHGQLRAAEAMQRRHDRIQDNYGAVGVSLLEKRRAVACDVYTAELFGSPDVLSTCRPCGLPPKPGGPGLFEEPDQQLTQAWSQLLAGVSWPLSRRAVAAVPSTATPACEPPIEWTKRLGRFISGPHFSALFMSSLPIYHAESVAIRRLAEPACAAASSRINADRTTTLEYSEVGREGVLASRKIATTSAVPSLPSPEVSGWILLLLAAGVVAACGALLLRWLGAQLFGMAAPLPRQPSEARAALFATGGLFIGDGEELGLVAGAEVIDLSRPAAKSTDPAGKAPPGASPQVSATPNVPAAAAEAGRIVLATHLEICLEDLKGLEDHLQRVEALVAGPRPVFICSKVDPLTYFRRRLQSRGDDCNEHLPPAILARWARALERLVKVQLDSSPAIAAMLLEKEMPRRVEDWVEWRAQRQGEREWAPERKADLEAECTWTARLRAIRWEVWATADAPATREEVVHLVREAASAHYRTLWAMLTDEEQLCLVQLAAEGFVNPKNWRIVGALARRGFLRFTPAVRLANESLCRFVLSEATDDTVRVWEKADGASWWDRARDSIVYVLMAGGVFLYLTRPDEIGSMAAILGAVSGAAAKVAGWLDVWGVSKKDSAARSG